MDQVINGWLHSPPPEEEDSTSSTKFVKPRPPVKNPERHGDAFEEQRRGYAAGESDEQLGLAPGWWPTREDGLAHDCESLLGLALSPPDGTANISEVKQLLEEFFVDEDRTSQGRRRRDAKRELDKAVRIAAKAHEEQRRQDRAELHLPDQPVSALRPSSAAATNSPRRVWGGSEDVHPASLGASSQRASYRGESPSRAHPAMFAAGTGGGGGGGGGDEGSNDDFSSEGSHSEGSEDEEGGSSDLSSRDSCSSSEESVASEVEVVPEVVVLKDMEALNLLEPVPVAPWLVLFEQEGRSETSLLSEQGAALETRESRTHRFQVPESDEKRLLSLSVTVVYRGVFTARGFRFGRLAVALFRLPTDDATGEHRSPVSVGFAPYASQQLNTGNQLGRTVLVHRPEKIPLAPGAFQLVVGAASATKYSVQVEATSVFTARATLARERERAVEAQEHLSKAKAAIADLWTSMRLAERKALVVQALMDEAEVESSRCERETERCNTELSMDDERMELTDDQRRSLYAEVRALEVEFAHWCRLFASRSLERKDLLSGILKLRSERSAQTSTLELKVKELKWLRRHLPAATGLVDGMPAATAVALEINASFEHIKTISAASRWDKLSAVKTMVKAIMTPAEDVRQRHKLEGWKALNQDERRWSAIDRLVRPDKYEWLDEEEKFDCEDRRRRGLGPKKSRTSRSSCASSYARGEVERIVAGPFETLTRKEQLVYKLVSQFHDSPKKLLAQAARDSGADKDTAGAIRCKHPKSRTQDEREWCTMDQIVNPDLWRNLKVRAVNETDSSARGNLETPEQLAAYLLPSDEVLAVPKGTNVVTATGASSSKLGGLVRNALVESTERAATLARSSDGADWACQLSREQILAVWAARLPQAAWSVDECKCFQLLSSFSGQHASFAELQRSLQLSKSATASQVGNRIARRGAEARPVEEPTSSRSDSFANSVGVFRRDWLEAASGFRGRSRKWSGKSHRPL